MPEGDTISRLAAKVRHTVGGCLVVSSTFRHPRLATVDLAGRTLTGTESHGKHLFVHFDDGWSLHIHLGMDGRVRFTKADRRVPGDQWHRRFEIVFAGEAPQRMTGVDIPLCHLVRTSETFRVVEHLGPDLCGFFDAEAFGRALTRLAVAGAVPLSAALLDQRRLAGFGNVYAVEVPFICGVSPFQPIETVDGLDSLLAAGAALIRTNARLGPQNTTGRRMERPQHWVLDSSARNCPLCGTKVRRLSGEVSPWRRRTAWCPACQAEPAGGASNVANVDVVRARRLLGLHPARRLLDFGERASSVAFIGGPEPVEPR